MSERWPASTAFVKEHSELSREEARAQFAAEWEAEHGPMPYASLDDVLDHFDHVIELVGVDHVGIGSDYDGVGDSLPTGLKDVSTYPNLVEGLLRRGYSEADIRKILGENLLRVWQAVDDYAATTSTST
jgi:membrane dipeptidase